MKYNRFLWILTLASLFTVSTANADSAPGSSPKEQELIQAMNEAEAKAFKAAEENFSAKDAQPAPKQGAAESPTPSKKTSDEMLQGLVKEVERLRSKEVITQAAALSTQKPRPAKRVGTKTIYSYKEGDVYEVYTAVDRVTDLELKAGENLSNAPVAGDTVRWKISIVKSGVQSKEVTHVILKPLDTDLETNFILITDKHTYQIRAISADWYMPSVSWNYPQEEDAELLLTTSRQAVNEVVQASPEALRFDYDVEGDSYDWKPIRVFDDGAKTYLQMPKTLRVTEAPALFIVESDEPMLVNYRVKGDYYIVDRLFERAELRVGPKKRVQVYGPHSRLSLLERIFE